MTTPLNFLWGHKFSVGFGHDSEMGRIFRNLRLFCSLNVCPQSGFTLFYDDFYYSSNAVSYKRIVNDGVWTNKFAFGDRGFTEYSTQRQHGMASGDLQCWIRVNPAAHPCIIPAHMEALSTKRFIRTFTRSLLQLYHTLEFNDCKEA